MTNRRTSTSLYAIAIWLAALALALVTYLQPGTHLEFTGGIDHAWAYTLNYAFDKRWVMGRDLYFTFGPLGFLEHTRVVSLELLYISSAFSLLVSVAMSAALLHLAWISTSHRGLRVLNIAAVIVLAGVTFPYVQRLLVLGYAVVFLHWMTRRTIYLVLLAVIVTLSVLIKFSYGAAMFVMLAGYLALLCWKQRSARLLWIGAGGFISSYLVIWLLIYGGWQGAFGYLESEFHISRGNGSAMALNPENNWPAVIGFYVALLYTGWFVHKKYHGQFAIFPAVFFLPLLVWTKYTFSQQEAYHMVPIISFAVYLIGIFLIVAPRLHQKIQIAVLIAITWYAWVNMHTESTRSPDYTNAPHLTFSKPEILKGNRVKELYHIWRTAEKERLQLLVLPDHMKRTIGDATVDVYPWDLMTVAINEFNWRPRPVFQIYIAYLPFLDKKNADFFNDDARAPEYILWHHHFYQDITNRYSLSSDPLTVASILDRYRMLSCQGYFCLWKRTETSQMKTVEASNKMGIRWNEWVDVPSYQASVLRGKLFAHRTLLGKLNLMAWKEGGIDIDYELADGSVKTHTLLIDNAVSGVWISPYIGGYPGDTSVTVEEISSRQLKGLLSQAPSMGYMESVKQVTNGYFVGGWIAVRDATQPPANYLLAYNEKKAYLLDVDEISRGDVAEYFASQGIKIQTFSGIHQVVDEQQLAPGNYKVRFAVRHGEQWSVLQDQGYTITVAQRNTHNMPRRFRIRTSRPWAFDETVDVIWQELVFNDGAPWK